MLEDGSGRPRSVVPRWRPLSRTPAHETRPLIEQKNSRQIPASYLTDALDRWNDTQNLGNASDVIDAVLTYEKYEAGIEAARYILNGSSNPVAGLRSAAEQVMGLSTPNSDDFFADNIDNTKRGIYQKISSLKARIEAYPRDAMTVLEIGRLQALVGQNKSAHRYIKKAILQEPNNRYILRCATRFFVHSDHTEVALDMINRSDAVRTDPWIQAAEVAAADMLGKSPRWGTKLIKSLASREYVGIEYSELAAGLATLEYKNGSQRRYVGKLLSNSLISPTENALAQAVWVNENANTRADVSTQTFGMPSAHEARVLESYENGNGRLGAGEAWAWLKDQPLSLAPALAGSYFTGTLLCEYGKSLKFLELATLAHPNHPSLINNKIVAHCYMGNLEQAKFEFNNLERYSGSMSLAPYILAAQGLIAFRSGNILEGRKFYQMALDKTKKDKEPRLTCYAALYWLEQEVYCGSISYEDAMQVISEFDYQLNNASKSFRRFVLYVWKARKPLMEAFINSQKFNASSTIRERLPSPIEVRGIINDRSNFLLN